MKRAGFIVVLCSLLLSAKAQDWSERVYKIGKIYPGFYVTNANDTIGGYFLHDDKKGNQKKCRFYANEMDKKPTAEFKPEDIKCYSVGDKVYRTVNYSGGLLNKPLRFLLIVKDGGITEYVFYSEDAAAEAQTVFHKRFDPLHYDPVTISYFGLGFAKKLSDYISDYPALSKKVSDKEKGYGMLNLLAIIAEYNVWFASSRKI